ncbi:MAG: type II secretion system protein GspK, partial [Candidatus Omnitrophica bacterium]|nr:type II secretion system protein GspK [Candidatus Omnitrophota bacterium]
KEKFNIFKNYLTIYGSGKININTAERKVLLAVFNSILDFLKEYMRRDFTFDTDSFVDQIIVQREGQPFKNMQELLPLLEQIPIDSGIINIFLDALFTISSTAFQTNIEVNMGKVKKSVEAIFDTEKNKVVYWNEN